MDSQTVRSVFAGTADDYAAYRPPYPEALLGRLRRAAGTPGDGVVVDLACGPGRVAIPLAPHVRQVLALDVEPEMVAVGRRRAAERGITNIDWQVGRAEDLSLAPASVALVTIGEAFHRLDQPRVLALADAWLAPGGCLATLGGEPVWGGAEPWKRVLVDVSNRWTKITLADPATVVRSGPDKLLRAAGWDVQDEEVAVEMVWTTESLVGFMRSTSFASRAALGERAAPFEAELRRALLEVAPDDRFPARQRFGFTLATRRRPTQGG